MRCISRSWSTGSGRTCAGAPGTQVQYFAAIEPQRRLAPHLHAAIRGAIPRVVLRTGDRRDLSAAVVAVVRPARVRRTVPVWDGAGYCRPGHRGRPARPGSEALDELETNPDARPAHVAAVRAAVRHGRDRSPPPPDADRAIRYLTKYLDQVDRRGARQPRLRRPGLPAHIDRLHAELRWLPCSPGCANWLRYGVQPAKPVPGLEPGLLRKAGARPGEPRLRRPPRPGVPAVVRQDPCRAPCRPRRRGAGGAAVGRDRCPGDRNGWRPPSPCPTGRPGSCGATPDPIRRSTRG